MAKGSGGGGKPGRSGGASNESGDAGQPGEVVREANKATLWNPATEKPLDQSALAKSIKSGEMSRDQLSFEISRTKERVNLVRSKMDTMLANRGKMKASDIRASKEFSTLANARDTMKGNLDKMFTTLKETSGKKKMFGSENIRF